VSIGGFAATSVVVTSATVITAVAPQRPAGLGVLVVTNLDGLSGTLTSGFTTGANNAPSITSVTPPDGPLAGGTTLSIAGSGFLPGAVLQIGGAPVTIVSQTATLINRGHARTRRRGSLDHRRELRRPQRQRSATGFTYKRDPAPTITASPRPPVRASAARLSRITGASFVAGATVKFDLIPSPSVSLLSPTSLIVISPPNIIGAVSITVTNPIPRPRASPLAFTYKGPAPEFHRHAARIAAARPVARSSRSEAAAS